MRYANFIVRYDEQDELESLYSSNSRRYYSWRSKLAAFWIGLSSLFPFSTAFAQQLKQAPDPMGRAIEQRGKMLRHRSALAHNVLRNVTKYAEYVRSTNESMRKAAFYGGQQDGDHIFYAKRHGIYQQDSVKLLVSQLDTVVASNEIKNILTSPPFYIYLRNQLNDISRDSTWATLIQNDSLLSSIAYGEQDQYRSYTSNIYQYAEQERLKVVATPESIDIKVYDSPRGSVLYSIRLTIDGFAAHPSTKPYITSRACGAQGV